MSTGLIREASEQDASSIIDLWTVAYVSEGEGGRTAPYSEADFIEIFRRGQMFVAEQEGKVVGAVALAAPGTPGCAIALWSRRYQTAAHRLYESLGYKRLPKRDETDESGHERLVFRLALRTPPGPLPEWPPWNP